MFNKPSKDTVLTKYALRVSPIPDETCLLMRLYDKSIINTFSPGDEPLWPEVLAYLYAYNQHLDIHKIIHMIRDKKPEKLYDR